MKPFLRVSLGFVAPQIVAVLLIQATRWIIDRNEQTAGVLVFSNFIIVPLLMGIVSAFFWRDEAFTTGRCFLNSLLNTGLALGLSYFFLAEGIVCLVIVSPLLLSFVFVGTLLGRTIFQRPNRLTASLVPLLLAVLVADVSSRHDHHALVTDHLLIQARPATVWRYMVQVPPIDEPARFWLFRIGLPRPTHTTASGERVGAERRCVFSGNLVFDERIVECEPGRRLTFDIVRQPPHPEILGHLTLTRGQMILRDNGDGTTTLIGKTWYRLHVYPAWYYDLWAASIGRQVHARVMGHIKRLAEADHESTAFSLGPPRRAEARPTAATGF